MSTPDDPQWPRASAWLASGGAPDIGAADGAPDVGVAEGAPDVGVAEGATDVEVAEGAPTMHVLGAPLSATSLSPSRADLTPAAVRAALRRFSTTYAADDPADDVDLSAVAVRDVGDVPLAGRDTAEAMDAIAAAVAASTSDLVVVLGGDNAVTRPAVRGRCADLARTGLLTLDAHHDLRGFHAGLTNGTPVRGLLDDGLPGRQITQIGLGTFTNSGPHRRAALAAGITVVTVAAARRHDVGVCVRAHLDDLATRCDAIWVDLDVDVLDSAFAPGCPGARPGGMTPAELLAAAFEAGRHPKVVGVDIVEVDASADPHGTTVDVAAQCLLHAAAGLATRARDSVRQ